MLAIEVGGRKFTAVRKVWERSPVIAMFPRRAQNGVSINRDPAVFQHILDWLLVSRLHINLPDNATYEQLCADADFYGLQDLQTFLANRVNLCQYVYLRGPTCTYLFDLQKTVCSTVLKGVYPFVTADTVAAPIGAEIPERVFSRPDEEHVFISASDHGRVEAIVGAERCRCYGGEYWYVPNE